MDNYVLRRIRRSRNRLLFISGAWIVVIALVLFVLREESTKSLRNALFGPYALSETELGELKNPRGTFKEFVTVQGTVIPWPALDNVSVQYRGQYGLSRERVEHYVLLRMGQQAILVRTEKPMPATSGIVSFTGELSPIPEVESNINFAVLPGQPDLVMHTQKSLRSSVIDAVYQGHVAEVAVDTVHASSYRAGILGGTVLTAFFCIGLVGVFVLGLVRKLTRTVPWLQLVQRGDPDVLAKQIEEERFARGTIRIGDVYIGSHWIVVDGWFAFSLAHLDDLMGFGLQKIEGGRYVKFMLNLYLRSGQIAGGKINEEEYASLARLLHQRYPWLYEDADGTWEKQWKKRKDELIAHVQARKATVSSQKPSFS